MTARELFGVIVRSIGLVVSVVGLSALRSATGSFLSMTAASPGRPPGLDGDPPTTAIFFSGLGMLALGMLLLFGASLVVRVVYGRE